MHNALPIPIDLPVDAPCPHGSPTFHALETRQQVGDLIQVHHNGQRLPPEEENEILSEIKELTRLVQRKKLNQTDREAMRTALRNLGHESLALQALEPEGVRRLFVHLSGAAMELPYCFPLPLEDQHLEHYLFYEMNFDKSAGEVYDLDPQRQEAYGHEMHRDLSAKEFISDPVDSIGINILVSRLKGNPDFFQSLVDDPRIYDRTGKTGLFHYLNTVPDNPNCKAATNELTHYFLDKKRLKLMVEYTDAKLGGRGLKAADLRKKIRKLDERFHIRLMDIRR